MEWKSLESLAFEKIASLENGFKMAKGCLGIHYWNMIIRRNRLTYLRHMLKNISVECGKILYSDEIEKYINNYDENFILDVDEAIFMCTDNDNSKYHESSSIMFTRIDIFRKQELGDYVRGYIISVYAVRTPAKLLDSLS